MSLLDPMHNSRAAAMYEREKRKSRYLSKHREAFASPARRGEMAFSMSSDKRSCPRCGSAWAFYGKKAAAFTCRRCGLVYAVRGKTAIIAPKKKGGSK